MPIFESRKARAKEVKIAEWKQSSANVLATLKIPHAAIARRERDLEGTLALPRHATYEADEKHCHPASAQKPAHIAFCHVALDVRPVRDFPNPCSQHGVCRST